MSSNNDLMLDVDQAGELKMSFRRNGYTNADIKTLSEGNILGEVLKVIRGQAEIVPIGRNKTGVAITWTERDGVIYFSLTSNGRTGREWIDYFAKIGYRVGDYAKSVLLSDDFKPTSGVTYEIAVLKGMLFNDSDRTTENIRAEADKRKLMKPNAEVACLIREKFTDEELKAMDLWWIVVLHKPINDSVGDPKLLDVSRVDGGRWLGTYYDRPGSKFYRGDGFAFVVSQVGLEVPAL